MKDVTFITENVIESFGACKVLRVPASPLVKGRPATG
jgi:hypothetical protein